MNKLFGTDGIRGIVNQKLTGEFAFCIGKYGANVLSKNSTKNKKIIVGMDTRLSSPMLENSICSGIASQGIDCIKISYIPTPAIGYLIKKYNLVGGIMISASHNPSEYNGIKFFDSNGFKLNSKLESEIEKLYFNNVDISVSDPFKIGKIEKARYMAKDYEDFLLDFVGKVNLKGYKIALDCANGSAYLIAETVFRALGAKVMVINNKPDGFNINNRCGSTYMDEISKYVVENNCDFGFSYDGDADRCLGVDHEGNIINGDFIIGIIGLYYKDKGILKDNTVVTTVMSNLGLYKALEENNINVSKVSVGDKYVFEDMNKNGYTVGGEQSGHIILLDNKTGDGILTSLVLSEIIKKTSKTFKELASFMIEYPQILLNVMVPEGKKKIYEDDLEIKSLIDKFRDKLGENGRILVRESGTESLIRIMIEGSDDSLIMKMANDIKYLIENKL